jgi:hypothetical protein
MHTDLEEQVRNSLDRSASYVQPLVVGDGAWGKAQRHRRNRQRARVATSVLAAVALLSAGFGVYKATDIRKRNVAQGGEIARVRLIPVAKEGVSYTVQDQMVKAPAIVSAGFEDMRIWKKGTVEVSLTGRGDLSPGYTETLTQAVAKVRSEVNPDWHYLTWTDGVGMFILSASRETSLDQLEQLAKSATVDPVGKQLLVSQPPMGLPEVFHGDPDRLEPLDGWFLWSQVRAPNDEVSINGILQSPQYREIFGSNLRFGILIRKLSMRGHNAVLFSYESWTTSAGSMVKKTFTRYSLQWIERGWEITVSGSKESAVLETAATLQDATDAQWAAMKNVEVYPAASTPAERRIAKKVAATVETPAGDLNVRSGELVTKEGCANLVFEKVSGKDETQCVKTAGSPVLWSGVREVGGKKMVVAVVDLHVDAVTLTADTGAVSTQIVSSLTLDSVQPAGFVVDTAENGAEYRWIGIVALPFDGESPGQIEAFTNTEFDREAASELVDTDNPAADAETATESPATDAAADDEAPYDMQLKSLGRFPVG